MAGDVGGESAEELDLDDNWSLSISCRNLSASDVHPAKASRGFPGTPPASRGGVGAGRIDLLMLKPRGFFLETEEVLSENELEVDADDVSSDTEGIDLEADDVGRRKDKGESDMTDKRGRSVDLGI